MRSETRLSSPPNLHERLPHDGDWLPWLFLCLGLMGLPGVGFVFLMRFPTGSVAILTWIVSLVLSFNLPIAGFIALHNRRIARQLASLQADYLVCWRYRQGEAECLIRADRQAQHWVVWAGPLAGLILGLLLAAGCTIRGDTHWQTLHGMPVLGKLALGLGSGLYLGMLAYLFVDRGYRLRQRAPRIAYIGRKAAYCCGAFSTWGRWPVRLKGLDWVKGDPSQLCFRLLAFNPDGPDYDATFHVPIPRGHEAEAAQVYRTLTGREPPRMRDRLVPTNS